MKKILSLTLAVLIILIVNCMVWYGGTLKGQERMISASRVMEAMQNMTCVKYADLPLNNNKVYRCDNSEVICYITAPEAQMQCKFL